jgi:hypothetical protein
MEINPANQGVFGPNGPEQNRPAAQSAKDVPAKSDALDSSLEGYIAKALAEPASDSDVNIEQIRQELDAGQLDSPEAIRQAAENILNRGI